MRGARDPLVVVVGHVVRAVGAERHVGDERVGPPARAIEVRTDDVADRTTRVGHRIERDPRRRDEITGEREVGHVLVPGRLLLCAGLLHQHAVLVEPDVCAAEQGGDDGRQGGVEGEVEELRLLAPVVGPGEEPAAGRARCRDLLVDEPRRAGPGEVVGHLREVRRGAAAQRRLERHGHAGQPVAGHDAAKADHTVAPEGRDLRIRDEVHGPYPRRVPCRCEERERAGQ